MVDAHNAGFDGTPSAVAGANGGLPVLSVSGTTLAYTISTLTTYTGNTPQTGDSFARIGATGSGLTSLAPSATALSTATWTGGLATSLTTLAGHDPGSTLASATGVTAVPAAVWAVGTRTLTAFAFSLSVNVAAINGVTLTGDGILGNEWGPV